MRSRNAGRQILPRLLLVREPRAGAAEAQRRLEQGHAERPRCTEPLREEEGAQPRDSSRCLRHAAGLGGGWESLLKSFFFLKKKNNAKKTQPTNQPKGL